MAEQAKNAPHLAYRTRLGRAWHGDSRDVLARLKDESVDLILTSPPFALTTKKAYGNHREAEYLKWFGGFVPQFKRILKDEGSLVLDLGGTWLPKMPSKSIYQYRLLIQLVDDFGFHLAQDFVWWNTAKLPGPRQWATIDRVRAKDALHQIWWLSKTPYPKADNRKVLRPYSKDMLKLIERGTYNKGRRPSEHKIGDNFARDLGGAIPPNVIDDAAVPGTMLAFGNTHSREGYQDFCFENFLDMHPARFPRPVVEFFIRFLTDEGDTVVDPFGGSNMTGGVAEEFGRRWVTAELDEKYLAGSLGRFPKKSLTTPDPHLSDLALNWPAKAGDNS